MSDYNSIHTGSEIDSAISKTKTLTSDAQTQINSKENTLIKGDLTESTSSVLTITGGTEAIIGSGLSVQVKEVSGSQDGYLSSTDWNTFNNKQNAISGAASTITSSNLTADRVAISNASGKVAVSDITSTELNTLDNISGNIQDALNAKENTLTKGDLTETGSSILTITGGSNSVIGTGTSIEIQQASESQDGYLSQSDYAEFKSNTIDSTNLSGTANQISVSPTGTNVLVGSTPVTLSLEQDIATTSTPEFSGLNLSGLTAERALQINASNGIESSNVTNLELSYLEGVTSSIQNQIDNVSGNVDTTDLSGTINQISVSPTGTDVLVGSTPVTLSLEQDIATSSSPTFTGMILSGLTANRVNVTDGSKNITSSLVTDNELEFLSGTTSNVQNQIDSKASNFNVTDLSGTDNQILLSENGTGVILGSTPIQISLPQNIDVSATPIFAGLQLNNLTDGRVVINDGNQLSTSVITNVELSYLDNLTGNVQSQINSIDASQITSGTFNIARIPAAALERLTNVADQAARYALTDTQVQNGDTVRENDTGLMYIVVDDTNLANASGYQVYTAGSAASVPYSGITDLPTTLSGYGITDGQTALDFSDITSGSNITLTGNTSEVIVGATPIDISIVDTPTFTGLNLTGLTADKVILTDGSKNLTSSSVGSTQLSYISNLNSDVQSQIDSKADDFEISDITGDSNIIITNGSNIVIGSTPVELTFVQDLGLSSTPVFGNINLTNLDLSKALTVDSNGLISSSSVDSSTLEYINSLSSNAQDQINSKQNTITGGATTITDSDLTGERALISNASGKVAVSSITESELNNLSGSTGNIQDQIDNITVATSNLSGDSNISVSYGTDVVVGSTPVELSLNTGNLTETGSSILSITNGTDSVLDNVTIEVQPASNLQDGYLTKEDWSNFNASGGTISTTDLNADGNIVLSPNGNDIIVGSTPVNISTVQNIGLSSTPVFANLNLTNLGQNIVPIINTSGLFESSVTGTTELSYISTLSSNAQDQIDSKENTLTKSDLTESTSSVLTITGGTNSQIGTGTSIEVAQSNSTTDGYLSSTDWNTFNNKLTSIDTSDLTGDSNINIFPTTSNIIVGSTPIELQLIQDITVASTPVFAGLKITNLTNDKTVVVDSNGELSTSDTGLTQLNYISTLSSNAQDQIDSKQDTLTTGNLTETSSNILTITGGTDSQIGTGTSIEVQQSSSSTDGFLSSEDWNVFNGKSSTFDTTDLQGTSNQVILNIDGSNTILGSTPIILSLPQNIDIASTPVFATVQLDNLSSDRVVIQNSNGLLDSSIITTTELSYLDNLSGNVQNQINNIDASQVNSGTFNIARIPAAALERLTNVADEAARFALTDNDVQNGDTVRENDTGLMYIVVDDTNLNNSSGYQVYTAGTAASVTWSGVTGTPTTLNGYGITDAQSALDFTDINNGDSISITGDTEGIIVGTTPISIDTIQDIRTNASPTFTTTNLTGLTADRVTVTDGSKNLSSSSITTTELEKLDNITENIQTALDSKASSFDTSDITGDSNITITNSTDVIVSATPVEISLIQDIGLSATPVFSNIELTNLTDDRVIIQENGILGSSIITKTELETLDNISGNIQDALNGKEDTLSKGDLTETTSDVINITGGTDAVIGSGVTLEITQATSSTAGYLSSEDWNNFNNKADAGGVVSSDLNGTTDQINVSFSNGVIVGSTPVTLSLPQSIATDSDVTFNSLSISGGDVQTQIDSKADTFDTSNIEGDSNLTITNGNNVIVSATPVTIELTQNITVSSTPVFANLELTNLTNDRVIYKNNDLLQSSNVDSTILSYLENVTSDIQDQLNAKEDTLTTGNVTESNSNVLTFTGNTDAIIGSGLTIEVDQADTSNDGYLTSEDWNTFNNKQDSIETNNIEGTTNQVTVENGNNVIISSTPVTLSLAQDLHLSATPVFAGLQLTGLTANRVVTTDLNQYLETSNVNTTELSYLSGVESSIQNQIDNIAAEQIVSGIIDIARLPKGALERLVTVADETARFALTTNDVQNGDSVRQVDTNIMYFVIDDENLDNSSGYQEYTAGTATSVPFSGITSKPTTLSGYGITDAQSTLDFTDINNGSSISITGDTSGIIVGTTPIEINTVQGITTSDSPTFTGTTLSGLTANRALVSNGSKAISSSSVTSTELEYISGLQSSIQDQLNSKASNFETSDLSGTANQVSVTVNSGVLVGSTPITISLEQDIATTSDVTFNGLNLSGLTASRAIVTDESKNLASSATSTDQIGYLSNISSDVQSQIDSKENLFDKSDITNGNSISLSGDATDIIISATPLTIDTIQDIRTSASPEFVTTTLSGLTANTALIANGSKNVSSSSVLSSELEYVSGVTSSIQNQLDSKKDNFDISNIEGTANQITVSNGINTIISATPVTLSLPQSISNTSDVQFGGITILDNQDANTKLQITNTNSHVDSQAAITLTSSNKTVEFAMNSASDIYWANKANLELDTESGFVINRGTTKLLEMDSDTGDTIFVGNIGIASTPVNGVLDVYGNTYIEGDTEIIGDVYLNKVGRDADNIIDFSTDNQIGITVNGTVRQLITSTGAFTLTAPNVTQSQNQEDATYYKIYNATAHASASALLQLANNQKTATFALRSSVAATFANELDLQLLTASAFAITQGANTWFRLDSDDGSATLSNYLAIGTAPSYTVYHTNYIGRINSTATNTVHQITNLYDNFNANVTTSYPVLRLTRDGVGGSRVPSGVDFSIGCHDDDATDGNTKLDINLTNGTSNYPEVTVMSLLSNGNIGMVSAPKNWKSTYFALQLDENSIAVEKGANNILINSNAYFDDTDSRWEYVDSTNASQIFLASGQAGFRVAPVGTANNPITWTTMMEITSVGVGILTTPSTGNKFEVAATSTATGVNAAWLDAVGVFTSGSGNVRGALMKTAQSYCASGVTNGSSIIAADISAQVNTASHEGTFGSIIGANVTTGIQSCGTSGAVTENIGVLSTIRLDDADGSITDSYMFKGAVSGSSITPTNNWGIHIIGEGKNYLSSGLLVNGATLETNGVDALSIKQGTDPTTSSADQISIFATSGASSTLGLRTEASIASETPTPDRTLTVSINGALYKIALEYVSGE